MVCRDGFDWSMTCPSLGARNGVALEIWVCTSLFLRLGARQSEGIIPHSPAGEFVLQDGRRAVFCCQEVAYACQIGFPGA